WEVGSGEWGCNFLIPTPHSPLHTPHPPPPVFKLLDFSSRIPDYFHNPYRTIRQEIIGWRAYRPTARRKPSAHTHRRSRRMVSFSHRVRSHSIRRPCRSLKEVSRSKPSAF